MSLGRWMLGLAMVLTPLLAMPAAEDLLSAGAAYRSALHHDPSLKVPLQRLLALYRAAERGDELLKLYRDHLQRYPQDGNAWAVLAQLQAEQEPAAQRATLEQAVAAVPGHPLLQHLLASALAFEDPVASRAASLRAVQLETQPLRQRRWARGLLATAAAAKDMTTIDSVLTALQIEQSPADERLEIAETLATHGCWPQAVAVLPDEDDSDATQRIRAELIRSRSLQAAGKTTAAAEQLDNLLARLGPDHWLRPEVLSRRLALAAAPEARRSLLARWQQAYEQQPTAIATALDLSEALRRESNTAAAIDLLQGAYAATGEARLATRLRELFTEAGLHHELLAHLRQQLAAGETNRELALELAYRQHLDGDAAAAADSLQSGIDGLEPAAADDWRLRLARRLQAVDLFEAADALAAEVLSRNPGRLDVLRERASWRLPERRNSLPKLLTPALLNGPAPVDLALDLAAWLLSEGYARQAQSLLQAQLAMHPHRAELLVRAAEASYLLGETELRAEYLTRLRDGARSAADQQRSLQAVLQPIDSRDEQVALLQELLRDLATSEASPTQQQAQRQSIYQTLIALNSVVHLPELRRQLELAEGSQRTFFLQALVAALRQLPVASSGAELVAALHELRRLDAENASSYLAEAVIVLHQQATEPTHASAAAAAELQPLLEELSLASLDDPEQVAELATILQQQGQTEAYGRALERLLRFPDPDPQWFEWHLNHLLIEGREPAFRHLARRLLAGETDITVATEPYAMLQRQVYDSCFRELLRAAMAGAPATELLPLLDAAAAHRQDPETARWVPWLRAVLRSRAAGEGPTAADWQHLIDDLLSPPEGTTQPHLIELPGGIRASPQLLSRRSRTPVVPTLPAVPLPPYQRVWQHPLSSATVPELIWRQAEGIFLVDREHLLCLEANSGRLRSHRRLPKHPRSPIPARLGHRWQGTCVPAAERLVIAANDLVTAYNMQLQPVWRASGGGQRPHLLLTEAGLLVLEIDSGDLTCLDAETGKRRWHSPAPACDLPPFGTDWEPLQVSGNRILVGDRRLLDLADGLTLYFFGQIAGDALPLNLRLTEEGPAIVGPGMHNYPVSIHHLHHLRQSSRHHHSGGWFPVLPLQLAAQRSSQLTTAGAYPQGLHAQRPLQLLAGRLQVKDGGIHDPDLPLWPLQLGEPDRLRLPKKVLLDDGPQPLILHHEHSLERWQGASSMLQTSAIGLAADRVLVIVDEELLVLHGDSLRIIARVPWRPLLQTEPTDPDPAPPTAIEVLPDGIILLLAPGVITALEAVDA